MVDVHHPVPFSSLPSKVEFHALDPAHGADLDGRVKVSTASLDHPGGVIAYRLDYRGRSVVYATDPRTPQKRTSKSLTEFPRRKRGRS